MTRLMMIVLMALWLSPANADTNVTRWVGQYAFDVMEDPVEKKRFRTIMDAKTFELFKQATSVASPIGSDGFWVVGEGCWPHTCDTRAGFFAIEIATGKPVAVMLFDGKRFTFGARAGAIPKPLADVINEYLRRIGS